MQWILQRYDDTERLAASLDRRDVPYSWHKVTPFVGDLDPEPEIVDPNSVILFGSYTLWRYAERRSLSPGVFKLRPFVHEKAWRPFLLNGGDALFLTMRDIPKLLASDERPWFIRPVDDSKEIAGRVRQASEIVELAERVLSLRQGEIPDGSLRHDTGMMLCQPAPISKEWRVWIVDDVVQTYSLYKDGSRVIYRQEIDQDALDFADHLTSENPNFAKAYVIDICRTDNGLRLLETNCINAAGFYAADLDRLVEAIEALERA